MDQSALSYPSTNWFLLKSKTERIVNFFVNICQFQSISEYGFALFVNITTRTVFD